MDQVYHLLSKGYLNGESLGWFLITVFFAKVYTCFFRRGNHQNCVLKKCVKSRFRHLKCKQWFLAESLHFYRPFAFYFVF